VGKSIMFSGLVRKWRPAGRSGSHVTVVEWREDGLLVLRATRSAAGQPEVQDAQFIQCAVDKREVSVARLAKQGWFAGGRTIVMLGIRQRQMAMLPRPTVPDAELVEAARWQLQGALDYPPEEAVLDVLRLGLDEPPARQQLAVFAVRRAELAKWLAPLVARKIKIEAVEVADCAQRNLAALHPSKGQPVAMLSLREDSIVFSVTRGSEVLVSRSFDAVSVKSDGSDHATEIAALAERVGLQLQRMLDTLERRSAAMAPSQILVLSHPQQSALLTQCAELTGLRVLPLDLRSMLEPAGRAPSAAPAIGDFLHLLGAALRPAPVGAVA
jgi:MSHA biogenesis protein MshI